MAKQIRTKFASSGYRGGRLSATDPNTGKIARGGRFITRKKRYGDLRRALGLSSG